MGSTGKSKFYQLSTLTLGLLIDIKERISSTMQQLVGKSQQKITNDEVENSGNEKLVPDEESTPHTGADPDGQLRSDQDHPDPLVSVDASSQPPVSNDSAEAQPSDLPGVTKESWQHDLDPSTEEDIPLSQSEVEIPHEIRYDKDDDEGVTTSGQDESNVDMLEKKDEKKPRKREVDSGNFSKDNRKKKKE